MSSEDRDDRQLNCRESASLLKFHGVEFRSANNGTLLVVKDRRPETPDNRRTIELWPSRGKWKVRGTPTMFESGVQGVLAHLDIDLDRDR